MGIFERMHDVSVLFQGYSPGDTKTFWLAVVNGKVSLVPEKSEVASQLKIIKLSNFDLIHGLTSQKWNQIEGKLRKLIKEKVL